VPRPESVGESDRQELLAAKLADLSTDRRGYESEDTNGPTWYDERG
jgi:hypothetical protein